MKETTKNNRQKIIKFQEKQKKTRKKRQQHTTNLFIFFRKVHRYRVLILVLLVSGVMLSASTHKTCATKILWNSGYFSHACLPLFASCDFSGSFVCSLLMSFFFVLFLFYVFAVIFSPMS